MLFHTYSYCVWWLKVCHLLFRSKRSRVLWLFTSIKTGSPAPLQGHWGSSLKCLVSASYIISHWEMSINGDSGIVWKNWKTSLSIFVEYGKVGIGNYRKLLDKCCYPRQLLELQSPPRWGQTEQKGKSKVKPRSLEFLVWFLWLLRWLKGSMARSWRQSSKTSSTWTSRWKLE